ncbi:MAG: hypothetical protein JW956_13715 [Calditrichaceae bacterium]|nr:hypothetical protein [Calditrichaceae bacterium]
MNITLSSDKATVEKARNYARKHNTSLNNLVRDFLKRITNSSDLDAIADEFEKIALSHSGKSEESFKFSRDEIYSRG